MSFLLVQYQQYPVGSLFLSHLPPIWWYIPITFRWARETKWQERMTWEWESSFIIRYQVTWSPDYFSFYYRPIAIVVFLCFATWDDNCLSTVPHQKLIYSVTVTSNGPILCSFNTGWLTKKNSEQKRVKTTHDIEYQWFISWIFVACRATLCAERATAYFVALYGRSSKQNWHQFIPSYGLWEHKWSCELSSQYYLLRC